MDFIAWLIETVDSVLIVPYRWPESPVIGWWIGTFTLAAGCCVLGAITTALVYRANHTYVQEVSQEMLDRHHQSINALKMGDKNSYKAINKLANEAYGKTFFLQMAMASASLWPVALALGWMQTRFHDVTFPLCFPLSSLFGGSVGYAFTFIPLYILCRIFFRLTPPTKNKANFSL
ncbi:hypothetical protein ACFL9U_15870 [Thermodesulfobacteriota bacterium]